MQTYSKLKYAHISPQKCRLIADVVRGKRVGLALSQLRFMPKKGAELVLKALESAVANAEHNHGADIDELKISAIQVDEAPLLKRFHARAKGRGIRLVITRDWVSKWYAGKKQFAEQIYTDFQVREFLRNKLKEASVSRVHIER